MVRALLVLGAGALLACGHDRSGLGAADGASPVEAGVVDAAADAGLDALAPCFTNPQTYLEIINACTDAEAVDKTDNLSTMNLPDGGLQPLP
jgi:hypothetical protein